MIVTTTSTLEGHTITEYVGVVSAHVVAGTGLSSDWAAAFTDILGGRSNSYQKHLAAIHDEATEALVREARRRRAHAIVGLRLDADEISGKGKSMLMVTATGTAVRLEQAVEEGVDAVVSAEDYLAEMERVRFVEKAGTAEFTPEVWAFVTEYAVADVAPAALGWAARELAGQAYVDDFLRGTTYRALEEYVAALPPRDAVGALYTAAAAGGALRTLALRLIDRLRLTDFDRISDLLRGDFASQRLGTTLAVYHKPSYSARDVESLNAIRHVVAGLAATSHWRKESVRGLMGTKEVTKCACGKEVNEYDDRCRGCQADEQGFLPGEQNPKVALRALDFRIALLGRMLAEG